MCIVGKCVGLPRDRGAGDRRSTRAWRWSPTRSSSCAAPGLRGALRRRALLRRLQAQPRVRAPRARGRGRPAARATLVLCDTNGGSLPHEVEASCAEVVDYFGDDVAIGVHLHDDAGCGVANALAGVRGGATQVQGTINGYGERTGNCNLTTIIPNLTLKMGVETIPRGPARAAHAGVAPRRRAREHAAQPAGSPTSGTPRSRTRPACTRAPSPAAPTPTSTSPPSSVGNGTRFVVSRARRQVDARLKAEELGLDARRPDARRGGRHAQATRARGLPLRGGRRLARAADAPRDRLGARLLQRRVVPGDHRRPSTAHAATSSPTEATVKVHVGGERVVAHRRGQRPRQRARRRAARRALGGSFPALERVHLTDYKVRVLDTTKGTGAVTRVLIDSTDGERSWTTIGVTENIIEASLAGAARLDRLRPAARRAARPVQAPLGDDSA